MYEVISDEQLRTVERHHCLEGAVKALVRLYNAQPDGGHWGIKKEGTTLVVVLEGLDPLSTEEKAAIMAACLKREAKS